MNTEYTFEQTREYVKKSLDIDFFNVVCDPVRSQLLVFLAFRGEMTIGKIAENFPQNRSVISRHLDLMNRLGAITRRKLGREVYYKINQEKIVDKFDTASTNIKKLFEQA